MDFSNNYMSAKEILCKIANTANEISILAKEKSEDNNQQFLEEDLNILYKQITIIQSELKNSIAENDTNIVIEEKKNLKLENENIDNHKPKTEEQDDEEKISKERIPTPFLKMYNHILSSGVEGRLVHNIMKLTLEQLPATANKTEAYARKYFEILLKKLIITNSEIKLIKNRQKVLVLIGQDGVGKTTTIAKLASNLSKKDHKKYKVGIISLDTKNSKTKTEPFKHEKDMKIAVENVTDINDFEIAFERLSDCDIVLIDTITNSKNDKEKLITLDALLRFYSVGLDINLVLDANDKCEKLEQVYKNYSFLDIDNIIFTKFDKAKKIGNIFSFIHKIQKPISYISDSEDCSKHIIPATSYFLVSEILKERG